VIRKGKKIKKIIHFKKIGSTHEYLKQNPEKYPDLTIILADIQATGRGQFGKKWHSPSGGLYFSIVLKPKKIKPGDIPLFTFAMALSITDTLEKLTGLKPELKWPNDVVIREKRDEGREKREERSEKWKKVAGILTDVSIKKSGIEWVVISAGVNVNNRIPESLCRIAASILGLTGKRCDKKKLLKEIFKNFRKYYPSFPRSKILNKYTQKSMLVGKEITLTYTGEKYTGMVTGFNQNGAIEMSLHGNIKKIFYSGEIIL